MDKLLVVIVLVWMGLILGSFLGAQVWRARARQLVEDKTAGEPVDEKELHKLQKLIRPAKHDRSECLSCHHQLAWYDLLPLVSWFSTGGRCRYCKVKIGYFEPLMELGMMSLFVVSYLSWPTSLTNGLEIVRFTLWLVACVIMVFLFAYDAKWSLLPFRVNLSLIVVAAIFALMTIAMGSFDTSQLISAVVGVAVLAGLYFVFALLGWVGLGDSILGVGLALLLLDWKLALLTIFLANFIGCLMLLPLALQRKLHRGVRIPFGPFLILGAIISMFWGRALIHMLWTVPIAL